MYIVPNSNIKIYKDVPLDNTYNHTLYFSSLNEQNAYFHGTPSILKYNLTSQSYQRVVDGSMRVAIKSDNLYDCNYLAFQNASLILATSSSGLKSSILEKANHFFPKSLMEAPT